jgi:hypothetical protein
MTRRAWSSMLIDAKAFYTIHTKRRRCGADDAQITRTLNLCLRSNMPTRLFFPVQIEAVFVFSSASQ